MKFFTTLSMLVSMLNEKNKPNLYSYTHKDGEHILSDLFGSFIINSASYPEFKDMVNREFDKIEKEM